MATTVDVDRATLVTGGFANVSIALKSSMNNRRVGVVVRASVSVSLLSDNKRL